ncbi:MAG: hypothetical protein AAGA58_08910 [Verrucomicrobiota bacterium]
MNRENLVLVVAASIWILGLCLISLKERNAPFIEAAGRDVGLNDEQIIKFLEISRRPEPPFEGSIDICFSLPFPKWKYFRTSLVIEDGTGVIGSSAEPSDGKLCHWIYLNAGSEHHTESYLAAQNLLTKCLISPQANIPKPLISGQPFKSGMVIAKFEHEGETLLLKLYDPMYKPPQKLTELVPLEPPESMED